MESEIKAVVIAENIDPKTGKAEMIQCLGVHDSFVSAYGEAVIFLSEMADDGYTITPLVDLGSDTGFGLFMKDEHGRLSEAAYILHASTSEREQKGDDAKCSQKKP